MQVFSARQRTNVTEVTFISLLWVWSKPLKSVHHIKDSNQSTLTLLPQKSEKKKNIEKRLASFPLLPSLNAAILNMPWTCLKLLFFVFGIYHLYQTAHILKMPPGGGSLLVCCQKVFSLSSGRGKVMRLVPHANNKNRRGRANGTGREVICFHISPTRNKKQLVYGW